MQEQALSKGQIVDLSIDSAAYKGMTVARLNNFVIFVKNAVPGDQVRARIVKKKPKYAEAVVEELVEPSVHRVKPRCEYFGTCGGCSWQDVDYEQQLIFKREQVREIFSHLAGFKEMEVAPTVPSPSVYYYRNKMEFSFGSNRWLLKEEIESGDELQKHFALGLHLPGRWDKVLDLHVCYLQSPLSAEIVNEVRRIALKESWSAYNTRRHEGYLRNLVIRTGFYTGEVMVNLVTTRNEPDRMKRLTDALLRKFPQITTVVNSINPTRSPVAEGAEMFHHGPGIITERIAHLTFSIAPTAFFQPNTSQAEQLCRLVKEMASLHGDEIVYDLYCGSGSFSLFLADSAHRIVGIEEQKGAVEGARENARANGIGNCAFHRGDVKELLGESFSRRTGPPEVVIADPPRAGMHRDVCRAILELTPQRILYVSCNPATQARDVSLLSKEYDIETVQPVDMFPQTYHIENVVALKRR